MTVDSHICGYQEFSPALNPYKHLFVDVTNRCNMRCANCYVTSSKDEADPRASELLDIFRQFPRRTNIRLLGGEPTLRDDLPELIKSIRELGHKPVLLTNGLRLIDRAYVKELKAAGLRSIHLSCNGGMDDNIYEEIDCLRCADRKMKALDNLCQEKFRVSIGMILVRDKNLDHLATFYKFLVATPHVRELKLRSVGQFGTFSEKAPLTMAEMMALCQSNFNVPQELMKKGLQSSTLCSFYWSGMRIQLTEWPDLNNEQRGYLTAEGTIVPFFEYLVAKESV